MLDVNGEHHADISTMITQLSSGDQNAVARLMPVVYDELREIAARSLRSERVDHTLQPTALVNEVFLRLAGGSTLNWNDEAHFKAIAARTIRQILIDHARRHNAQKRKGDGHRLTISDLVGAEPHEEIDLLRLDEAMQRLAALHERQARVVELRFFGGLTVEDASEVLGVSPRTVKGDWRVARAWLLRELEGIRA